MLFNSFIYGQNKYRITYNITKLITHVPIDSTEIRMLQMFDKIVEKSKETKYTLFILDQMSFFEMESSLVSDNNKNDIYENLIHNFFNFNKFVLTKNKADSITFKRNLVGKDILVKMKKFDLKWEIDNETKKINDYEVKKAIGKYYSPTLKTETDIEAWYLPSIPVQAGPDVFMGLPGLILEVHLKGGVITASKIEFVDEINIPRIDESKAISQEKYEKIINDLTKKYIDN